MNRIRIKISPIKICSLFVVILLYTSCRSSKDLIMLQDFEDNLTLYDIPGAAPEYRIKPFDNLYLSILTLDPEVNQIFNPSTSGTYTGTSQMFGDRSSQYINGYMVALDGSINVPIVGKVVVAGLNLVEAQERITAKAKEYLKEPNVKVKVLNFKVNVTGQVRSPGLYYNYEGSLNIVDAISMANGITNFANLKDVLLIRHTEDFTRSFNLDLTDKSVYMSEAFYLQPNDVLYVRPNRHVRSSENNSIYSLILSTISTILVATTILIRL